MGSIEFMLVPGYSYARQRAGDDDDECGDGTIANSALDIPAADHQAEFPFVGKAHRLNQNNMAGPAAIIVPPLKKHTATVIWAHGLGDRWVDVQLH